MKRRVLKKRESRRRRSFWNDAKQCRGDHRRWSYIGTRESRDDEHLVEGNGFHEVGPRW